MAMNETRTPNVRAAVVSSLIRTENGSKFSNLELDAALGKYSFSPKDKALFTALYYGVTERRITLDAVIGQLSSRPLSGIDPRAMAILRMALYQMMYLDRIPPHAAVSSAVELTRKGGTDGFVNAVLRAYLRDPGRFLPENTGLSGAALLSYRHSLPVWMIELWTRDYGAERAERIAAGASRRPPVTLRVNTLLRTREEVAAKLAANEVETELSPLCPTALRLLSHHPIEKITVIRSGEAFVQDEASQLCCEVLGASPGHFVIDACACPGGKSFSAAMMMQNSGRVLSLDLRASKLSLISAGAQTLGIQILETAVRDGREPVPEYADAADRVLCDVPCSGLGVLAKKPDIREKRPQDIEKLPEVQYEILRNNAGYVRPGGELVYSTCTLRRAENEDVVNRFLAEDSRFAPAPFEAGGHGAPEGQLTLFPEGETDGFFIAKFKRVR